MINWEEIYNMICERKTNIGHNHHIIPCHTGIKDDRTVCLSFSDHVLAHYIRYRWLHEKADRLSVQVLIRRRISKIDNEIISPSHNIRKKYLKINPPKPKIEKIKIPKIPKVRKKRINKYKELIHPEFWDVRPTGKKFKDNIWKKFCKENEYSNEKSDK